MLPGVALLLAVFALFPHGAKAETLRIVGSTTVNPPVAEAAEILRDRLGARITVDTAGGSSGGLNALGAGRADVAMSSRPIAPRDRERYPDTDFREHPIGRDAIALIVSEDVWESGVRALSAEEMRAVYEGRLRNWRELGGPDRRIAFYSKEPGRGTWEVFADWLYGDASEAPPASHLEVGANAEARAKVAGTRGALSFVSVAWADGETVFPLAARDGDGRLLKPRAASGEGGSAYPLARPLLLVTDGPPEGLAAELIEFMRGPEGRVLVERHGFAVSR